MDCFYVCDGSYIARKSSGNKPKSGIGVVHFLEGDGISSENRVLAVFSKPVESMGDGKFHPAACAEGLAVVEALNHAKSNSDVMVYTDNAEVVKFMNGKKSGLDGSRVEKFLRDAVARHHSVMVCHVSERNRADVPEYLFSIAHNAATSATGSKKKECTGEYVGDYCYNPEEPTFDSTVTSVVHNSDVTGMEIIGEDDSHSEEHPYDARYPRPKQP